MDRVAERVRAKGVDALFLRFTPFTNQHRPGLLELAARYRLPVISDGAEWVRGGGLMS